VPVATAGISSAGHNRMETIRANAKTEYKMITYDGGRPAVIATVAGETPVVAQLLVEMSEEIKAKRLVPLAVQADRPVPLAGYGELPPITKWLPNMPAPLNYFGIWVPKGAPDNVVKAMEMVWAKNITSSTKLKEYAEARSALFTPLAGQAARDAAWPMTRLTAWLYFDGGKAKLSPDTVGIPRL
jgi:tripartite-type tricarboxylate transporter receptor subunit TctC